MVRLLNERLEQHFPTMVMVREFEGVDSLNTDLESVIDKLSLIHI